MYSAVKNLHIASVILSGAGFLLRGALMMRESPRLQARWVRVVPHVNDTILLGAAITLMLLSAQYPFVDSWVTAKVFGLLAYIGLGLIALKAGTTKRARIVAGLAAMAAFIWIASVAVTKNPWGLLRALGG
jgi:uncharacterized membrane protein SirB2